MMVADSNVRQRPTAASLLKEDPAPADSLQQIVVAREDEGCQAWRIAIVYDTLNAGQRAFQLLSWLDQEHNEEVHFLPLFWRFDLLSNPDWRHFAAVDLMKADLIILSAVGPSDLPAHVRAWLESCIAWRQGTDTAIVALFGTADHMDGAESPRLQSLEKMAKAAGFDFFAPLSLSSPMGLTTYEHAPTVTWTHLPAAAMDLPWINQHWGINEY